MSKKLKIIMLAVNSRSTWLVYNNLKKQKYNVKIAIENPVAKLTLIKNRILKQGYITVIGQIIFLPIYYLLKVKSKKLINKLIQDASQSSDVPERQEFYKINSVNSEECREFLKNQNPDIVIINGTRIVSSKTLNSSSAIFLNTHCGITPSYRGVHGAYWALSQRDVKNVGVTIHKVDSGIDTGDIIYQSNITVTSKDNFATYPIRQYLKAIPLINLTLDDIKNGNLKTFKRNDLISCIWFHPTAWKYISNYLKYKIK